MAQYEIQFKASAAKEFRKLAPEIKLRIRETVNALKTDPRPTGVKKLVGETHLYRIRVGNYRVIYEIDDATQLIQVTRRQFKSEVHHPGSCPGGTHGDSLMFITTKGPPHELLPA